MHSHRIDNETTGDDNTGNYTTTTTASREYDSNKPPDYSDALAYRKSTIPNEGYPEPSLVDEPPPPSYDSVN